jgi:hypothetical protein
MTLELPSEKAKQKEINQWIFDREIQTDQDITQIKTHLTKNKSWYKSLAVWISIFLTLVVLYLCYIFISSESGENIQLPEFLNYEIKLK